MSNQQSFIDFSRPFIDAGKNVFETMVFTKLEAGKPEIKKDYRSRGDISAVLGLTGNLQKNGTSKEYKAMLVLSWPYTTYYKIASAMLMETFTEYSNEIADVGAEIANMIMGNAKRELATMGYSTNMAIPSIIEGAGHSIKYPPNTTIVMIPLNSAHGPFFIEICYTEE